MAGDGDGERREELDPLRAAILTGERVIVLTDGRLEPLAREAARVAGRLRDLCVVHAGAFTVTSARVRPGDRRAIPDEGGAPQSLDTGDLRAITVGRAAAHDGILVVQTFKEDGKDFVRHLLERLGEAGGRAPRVVGNLNYSVERRRPGLQKSWKLPKPFAWNGNTGWVLEDPDAALPDGVPAESWDRALGRGDWIGDGARGTGPGLAWIRSGTRAVVVRDQHGVDRPYAGAVDVFEIEDGWCTGISASYSASQRLTLDDIAGRAWRGGVGMARLLAGDRQGSMPIPVPARRLMGLDGREGPVAQAPVEDLLDLPLASSGRGDALDHAVLRLLARGEGDVRARRDFAMTWPAFTRLLWDRDALAAIDAGAETLPLVAQAAKVGIPVARRLAGRRSMPACSDPGIVGGKFPQAPQLRTILGWVGHDGLPAVGDDAGWKAFAQCASILRSTLNRAEVRPATDATCARLLLRSGRDWPARAAAMEKGDGDRAAAGDMVAGFAGWLSALAGEAVDTARALDMLAGEGSFVRLAERSAAWHADPLLRSGEDGVPDSVTWPVPFGRVDLGDGWHALPLGGAAALRAEGADGVDREGMRGLSHCVGGYAKTCWRGRSVIVSIRRTEAGRTTRESTAELKPDAAGAFSLGGRPYALNQHYGRKNDRPGPGAVDALARLQGMLAEGAVPVDPAALAQREGDPRHVGRRAAMLALHGNWRALMPRGLAALDVEELVRMARSPDWPPPAPRSRQPFREAEIGPAPGMP